jgi:alkylation response protein AidB-like acyl-CoA dehydrogenase
MAEALDYERFTVAGTVTRFMRQLDDLVDLAREWQRDGVPLGKVPRVRHKLARNSIDMEVARMHMLRVLDAASKGRIPNVEATMNKLWSTQLVQRVAETGVDSLGLYGQLREGSKHAPADGEFEQAICEHVIRTIAAGTSEVQKNILAKRALDLPG